MPTHWCLRYAMMIPLPHVDKMVEAAMVVVSVRLPF
jgi:hypothetical protein